MQPDFISECDAQRLAQDDPAELARIIASGALRATSLTFAAEHMGAATDSPLVARTLAPLLSHAAPVVREGAMIGLGMHPDSPEAVAVLRAHRDRETCPELASMLRCYLGECAPGCACSPPAAVKLSPDAWARVCELAGLNADECPACEGRGGTQRDDWGYEREDCPACSGTGLRAPQGAP